MSIAYAVSTANRRMLTDGYHTLKVGETLLRDSPRSGQLIIHRPRAKEAEESGAPWWVPCCCRPLPSHCAASHRTAAHEHPAALTGGCSAGRLGSCGRRQHPAGHQCAGDAGGGAPGRVGRHPPNRLPSGRNLESLTKLASVTSCSDPTGPMLEAPAKYFRWFCLWDLQRSCTSPVNARSRAVCQWRNNR